MRKYLMTYLIFLLIILGCTAVVAQYNSPNIRVTMLNQDPDPVQPGDVVEVRLKIENLGQETTEEVIVELLPSYPFSVYSGSAKQNIGKMQGAQTGADAVIIDYKVKVDEDAVEGDTELELRVRWSDNAYQTFTDNQIMIDVQTYDAVLAIDQVTIEDEQIAPGHVGSLTLMLKNFADGLLKDIEVTLNLNSTPFSPFRSTAQKRVFQIKSDYQIPLEFELIAKPDAEAGVYNIPVTIRYTDDLGVVYTKSDLLSMVVGQTPELSAYVKESTVVSGGKKGTVTLELANSGSTNVKFLQLTLLPSEDYEILSSTNTIYIGDIDSDDIETQDFDLFIKSVGELLLPVQVKYKDANNNPYEHTFQVPMRVYSTRERYAFGLAQIPYTTIIVVLALAGLGGYFIYRRVKKKK
ncbi:hypothetical protein GF342_04830 [Candidatus Woesearchaeota archaeon]|nr:hypothetical protein [Candidatus Woesearchaeota archaeon]